MGILHYNYLLNIIPFHLFINNSNMTRLRTDEVCGREQTSFTNKNVYSRSKKMKPYFSFQWHITDECDQRCKHCYIFSDGKHSCLKSMTWEQMQDTFYNCFDFCEVFGRTPYFYLTGGDPILHSDFWRLLELFHDHDIHE